MCAPIEKVTIPSSQSLTKTILKIENEVETNKNHLVLSSDFYSNFFSKYYPLSTCLWSEII